MNKQNNALKIDIDIDKLLFPAVQGLRRCYAFAGVVSNPVNSLIIKEIHPSQKLQLNMGEIQNENVYNEFKKWVLRNSLRELIELFSFTLDKIYETFYFIKNHPQSIDTNTINDVKRKIKTFKENDFPVKLSKINDLLNQELKNEIKLFKSLQSIRNAISHNASVIYQKNGVKIKLIDMYLFIEGQDSKKIKFDEINLDNTLHNNSDTPAQMYIEIKLSEKHFKKGEIITFTEMEIAKICWAVNDSINKIKIAMIKTAQLNALKVTDYEGKEIVLPLTKKA